MEQNEKAAGDRITRLENEIKVIKNEIQAVLLDLRETTLSRENPFSSAANPATMQPIVINQQPVNRAPEYAPEETNNVKTVKVQKPKLAENQKPATNTREKEIEEEVEVESVMVTRLEPEFAQTEKAARAPRSEPEIKSNKPSETVIKKEPRLDLLTMASLTGWAEDASKKLGRERTEAVLDISEAMGYLPGNLRPILNKLIALAPQGQVDSTIKTPDYIDLLMKLNGLLNKDNREEAALFLLSLISGDKKDE